MLRKNKVFQRLFISYTLSTFGDWIDMIAISVLIGFVWKADPILLALLPLSFAVPGLLLGQVAGVCADRWPKLRLLIFTDLASAVITVALVFAPNVYVLLGLLMLRSCAGTFNYPAQQAMTRQVVHTDDLLRATSLNGMVNQGSKVLAPLLGATLAAMFSPQLCLVVNAITFLLSALILLTVRQIEVPGEKGQSASVPPVGEESKLSFVESWKQGWAVLFRQRVLLNALLFGVCAMLALQLGDFQWPVVFREYDASRPELFGYTVAAVGIGSIAVISILSKRKDIRAYGMLYGGAFLLLGLLFGFMGRLQPSVPWWSLLPIALLGGIGNGLSMVATNYIMQKETPQDAIGRVAGISNTVYSFVMIISPLTGGVLVRTYGAGPTFFGIGVILLVLGVAGILLGRMLFNRRVGQGSEGTLLHSAK